MNERNSISDSAARTAPGAPQTGKVSKHPPFSRKLLFRLAAVFLGLFPLILLEVGLRVFDIGRPSPASDPLSGFNRNFPLFERHGGFYRTAPAREPFFCFQQFPVEKPPNAFRMFCLGGSTVHGHPYQSQTAFPQWLEMELAGSDPNRVYQAVNCGGVSYASYRLAYILKEVLSYEPDLIIVATGENEFLEDRTYQSLKSRSPARTSLENAAYSLRIVNVARNWGTSSEDKHQRLQGENALAYEVKPKLDERSGYASYHRDPAWHDRVAAQFEDSIGAMVKMCREARVPIVLVKLGSNLRDCPPFKSEHRAGLSAEDERAWQEAFDAATRAEEKDLQRALMLYRKAEALDKEYALLAYRIARVLDRLGHTKEAFDYFRRAKDLDICPLRILSRNEEILGRIASETKTPLVDAASLLASKSGDHIPGNDWYLDHVHPTIGGHQKIAQAIATQMREAGLIPNGRPLPEEKRREAYQRHLESLGTAYFADGNRRVKWLENWSRRERLFDETLPKDARGYLRMGFRKLELGDEEGAWEEFREALRRDPGTIKVLKEHADELLSEGRPDSADRLLKQLEATQR